MAIGFGWWIVAALIVATVGYPHVAVVVYVNAVWASHVTGAEAAHQRAVFIKQHDQISVGVVDTGIDVAATALGYPNAFSVDIDIDRARPPVASGGQFEIAGLSHIGIG